MDTKKWTYEQEQTLIDMKYEGYSYIEISEVLPYTIDALRKKHWKLMHEAYSPKWEKRIRQYEMEDK